MILGGGPNRIGQGIEFDYCCVHAAFALREDGYETIMVNCNPETVSTDYDTSDQLYFEPLTMEDVMNIVDRVKPDGVIVQFGGQTPLKLALPLDAPACRSSAHRPIASIWPKTVSALPSCSNSSASSSPTTALPRSTRRFQDCRRIGYPVLVRPSYVLGGRAMQIVYDGEALKRLHDRCGIGVAGASGADR